MSAQTTPITTMMAKASPASCQRRAVTGRRGPRQKGRIRSLRGRVGGSVDGGSVDGGAELRGGAAVGAVPAAVSGHALRLSGGTVHTIPGGGEVAGCDEALRPADTDGRPANDGSPVPVGGVAANDAGGTAGGATANAGTSTDAGSPASGDTRCAAAAASSAAAAAAISEVPDVGRLAADAASAVGDDDPG